MFDPEKRKVMIRRDVIFNEKANEDKNPHVVTELKKKSEESLNELEEPVDNVEVRDSEEKSTKVKRNPRLPEPRSPYRTRLRSRETAEESLVVAEVFMAQVEPMNLEEVLESKEVNKWLKAIDEELDSLEQNNTWKLVPRPQNKNVLTNRWIFRRKYNSMGEVIKYKARLVARGCSQEYGIDYQETFAPVVRFDSVRTLLAIAAAFNLLIYQFDVKTAFLHGDIEEMIYMEQPYGYAEDDRVCLLLKSLYGLKQAPRQWNKRVVSFLKNLSLEQSNSDPCIFYKITNNSISRIYIPLYVDDGLICGTDKSSIETVLLALYDEFKITYSVAQWFVGLQIEQNVSKKQLRIHQTVYTGKILKR